MYEYIVYVTYTISMYERKKNKILNTLISVSTVYLCATITVQFRINIREILFAYWFYLYFLYFPTRFSFSFCVFNVHHIFQCEKICVALYIAQRSISNRFQYKWSWHRNYHFFYFLLFCFVYETNYNVSFIWIKVYKKIKKQT